MKVLVAVLLVISLMAGNVHTDRPRLCPYKMRCPPAPIFIVV